MVAWPDPVVSVRHGPTPDRMAACDKLSMRSLAQAVVLFDVFRLSFLRGHDKLCMSGDILRRCRRHFRAFARVCTGDALVHG